MQRIWYYNGIYWNETFQTLNTAEWIKKAGEDFFFCLFLRYKECSFMTKGTVSVIINVMDIKKKRINKLGGAYEKIEKNDCK
jgi:hypothetical protein